MSEMIRKHIMFYGRVQGVGFRYHATYKASQCLLTLRYYQYCVPDI